MFSAGLLVITEKYKPDASIRMSPDLQHETNTVSSPHQIYLPLLLNAIGSWWQRLTTPQLKPIEDTANDTRRGVVFLGEQRGFWDTTCSI